MPAVQLDGTNQAVQLCDFGRHRWTKIYIANLTPNAIRISVDSQTLQAAGGNGGLPILNTDGIVQLDWKGKLWAIGQAAGIVSWECPDQAETHN